MYKLDTWQSNYEAVKAHVAETEHFPNKHTKPNNWCRYQRKLIKSGIMPEEQRVSFEALAASPSDGKRPIFSLDRHQIKYSFVTNQNFPLSHNQKNTKKFTNFISFAVQARI